MQENSTDKQRMSSSSKENVVVFEDLMAEVDLWWHLRWVSGFFGFLTCLFIVLLTVLFVRYKRIKRTESKLRLAERKREIEMKQLPSQVPTRSNQEGEPSTSSESLSHPLASTKSKGKGHFPCLNSLCYVISLYLSLCVLASFSVTFLLSFYKPQIPSGIRDEVIRQQREEAYRVNVTFSPSSPWTIPALPLDDIDIDFHFNSHQTESTKDELKIIERLFNVGKGGNEEGPRKRILVVGPPGMGKRFICEKVVSQWKSELEKESRSNFTFVYYVDLKRNFTTLENVFLQSIKRNEMFTEKHVLHFVLLHQEEILLILDGGHTRLNENQKEQLSRLVERRILPNMWVLLTATHEEKNVLWGQSNIFDRVVELKKIKETQIEQYLRDTFVGKYSRPFAHVISYCETEFRELCERSRFLLLFTLLLNDDSVKDCKGKTSLFKDFFDLIVNWKINKNSSAESKIDFSLASLNDPSTVHNIPLAKLLQFGNLSLSKLLKKELVFEEKELSGLNFNFLFNKTTEFNDGMAQEVCVPIRKSLVEFLAAFSVFVSSKRENFMEKVANILNEGLLPNDHGFLFYSFLAGLLNGNAHVLFERLLPYSHWFNVENEHFHSLLMEVEDSRSFFTSFDDLLPRYRPTDYYSYEKIPTETGDLMVRTKLLTLHVNHGDTRRNFRHFLDWDTCYAWQNNSLVVERLRLRIHDEENFIRELFSIKCRNLTIMISGKFDIYAWDPLVSLIQSIEHEKLEFIFRSLHEGELLCLLLSLQRELTERKWQGKHINRLAVEIYGIKNLKSLTPLLNIVKEGNIDEGLYLYLYDKTEDYGEHLCLKPFDTDASFSTSNETEIGHAARNIQELFQHVVESKSIKEFAFLNKRESLIPHLDFNFLRANKTIKKRYFKLMGSVNITLDERINLQIEEVDLVDMNSEQERLATFNSLLSGIVRVTKSLACTESEFSLLFSDRFQSLEELELTDIEKPHESIANISQLAHLRVLILDFYFNSSNSQEFGEALVRLPSSLRKLEVYWNSDEGSSTVLVNNALVQFLAEKIEKRECGKEKREMSSSNENEEIHALDELYVNNLYSLFNSTLEKIRQILLNNCLRRFCFRFGKAKAKSWFPSGSGFHLYTEIFEIGHQIFKLEYNFRYCVIHR